MSLSLTILGCHSATPRINAHPTAQYLEINSRYFLIDCGEGTQRQMRKYKVGFSKINHIFISHLHGDHFFGLIGLISTFGILNREKKLCIYGPKGIKEIINLQLKYSKSRIKYELIFHELNSNKSELIYQDKKVEVYTIPLHHRIYTNGFLFKEKEKPRKLNMSMINQFEEIQICDYNNLKAGKDFLLSSGEVLKNSTLTFHPQKSLSYAYCSDTSYNEDIIEIIKGSDILYHESTFLSDKEDLASKTRHSTAKQAGEIAHKAKVKKLILGHFSSRYDDISLFKEEGKEIFPNTDIAQTGKVFSI